MKTQRQSDAARSEQPSRTVTHTYTVSDVVKGRTLQRESHLHAAQSFDKRVSQVSTEYPWLAARMRKLALLIHFGNIVRIPVNTVAEVSILGTRRSLEIYTSRSYRRRSPRHKSGRSVSQEHRNALCYRFDHLIFQLERALSTFYLRGRHHGDGGA